MKDGIKIFIKNENSGKYLFILRDNKPNIVEANMWGLVGGGIDNADNLLQTAQKKILEEIGINVSDIKQIYQMEVTHNLEGREYKVTGYYFLAKTNAILDNINLTKGQKAEFFTLEEIQNIDNVAFAIKEIVAKHKELLV